VVGGPEKCFAISAGGQIAGHPAHWLSLQFPGWLDKLEPILCCHCIAQEAQKKKETYVYYLPSQLGLLAVCIWPGLSGPGP